MADKALSVRVAQMLMQQFGHFPDQCVMAAARHY
jgi:hypothetical protein